MTAEKFHMSMSAPVFEQVQRRVGEHGRRSTVIDGSLERYYAVLADSRRRLRDTLSDGELALVIDAMNGTLTDAASLRITWAGIQDAIELDALADKWQVDGEALIAKLRSLDLGATAALVDAVERYWTRVGDGEQPEATVQEVLK